MKDDSVPTERWRSKKPGGEFYYLNDGYVDKNFDYQRGDSTALYDTGNYFETEQEAKDYRDNLITKQQLKDLALKLNKGVAIDWDNLEQNKYSILYGSISQSLTLEKTRGLQNLGQVYCLNKVFLERAKKEIGEEKLIKLIKSGV